MYGFLLLCLLLAIESQAIWKVVKAMAGWAIDTTGHRSITARLWDIMCYTAVLLSMIQCNRLSQSWKRLSKYWFSVEFTLSIKDVSADRMLKRQIYKATNILPFSALTTVFKTLSSLI